MRRPSTISPCSIKAQGMSSAPLTGNLVEAWIAYSESAASGSGANSSSRDSSPMALDYQEQTSFGCSASNQFGPCASRIASAGAGLEFDRRRHARGQRPVDAVDVDGRDVGGQHHG